MCYQLAMSHIFVSYSRIDEAFVIYLVSLLKDEGFTVWLDKERLDTGEIWSNELKQAIIDCVTFIIVMSPDAENSKWVQNELRLAEKLDKPILPVHYRGEIWWSLSNIQVEDMTQGLDANLSPSFINQLSTHAKPKTMTGNKNKTEESVASEKTSEASEKSQKQENAFDWKWVIGAVVIPLVAALIAIAPTLFSNNNTSTPMPSNSPESTPSETPCASDCVNNPTPSQTLILEPTDTECLFFCSMEQDPDLSSIALQRSQYLAEHPTSDTCLNESSDNINVELGSPDIVMLVIVKNGEITGADVYALIPPGISFSRYGTGESTNILSGNSYYVLVLEGENIPGEERCFTSLP